MKVWITKYALTRGIFTENTDNKEENESSIFFKKGGYHQYYYGNTWHKTESEAIKRAKEMQAKKIKSLEKQLEKIRGLKFD